MKLQPNGVGGLNGSPITDMRFFVIGSCRVHGPLSIMTGYSSGMSGYTHNAKEAIQHISLVQKEKVVPDKLRKFVFGRDDNPWRQSQKDSFNGADIVVVEISTGKINEFDGWYLQSNYMSRFSGAPDGTKTYTQDDLVDDIEQLKAMTKQLLVVQHIEIPGLESRSEFAKQLRDACDALDVPVYVPRHKTIDSNHYDPTVLKCVGKDILEMAGKCLQ